MDLADNSAVWTNFQICRIVVLGENGGESLYLFQLFAHSNGNNFYVGPLESLLLYN